MAEFFSKPSITFKIKIVLTEDEARALHDLSGYGIDNFVSNFYQFLGRAYMEEHEQGLRSLFDSVNKEMPIQLSKIDKTRKIFLE